MDLEDREGDRGWHSHGGLVAFRRDFAALHVGSSFMTLVRSEDDAPTPYICESYSEQSTR